MDFYRALSKHYDEIFPLKGPQKQLIYVRKDTSSIRCVTGTFAIETSQSGVRVQGVDLSDEMIRIFKK